MRQIRIDGTPVTETRLRIPDGDAVQRVWTVADHGGLTIMEIENESARPIAVALTGGGLLTERPPSDVEVKGIQLDSSAIVLPVGHRSSARVAISHRRRDTGPVPARVPPVAAVVSGWLTVCERASRLGLPDQQLVDAVVARGATCSSTVRSTRLIRSASSPMSPRSSGSATMPTHGCRR